ncbi:MAG: ABC transporter substrate-binding protein [Proteobacteria bacterium]|nr:ABC transporter substrate-binding protein [Pseudomonadota bacterium]
MKFPPLASVMLCLTALCSAQGAVAQAQGVTKDQILIGSILDLSGPLAGYGKDTRNGLLLRFSEANEQGGVAGRKIKLLIEDSGYDPKRGVLAAQKLVGQDKVFLMVANTGTAINQAVIPMQEAKNVMNFFPMALGRDLYEPVSKHKFAFQASYFETMQKLVPRLYRDKKATRACAIYQDDDFGLEVMRGTEAGLKSISVEVAERATFKRGATDFSSQVAKLKAANCDFVAMGTLIRETVGVINEARKLGFSPVLMTAAPAYTDLVPKLGGKSMDGLYSVMTAQQPYDDDASPPIRRWAQKYRTAYNESPTVFSVYGYSIADSLVRALDKAGPSLSTDTLAKAIEASSFPSDMFGTPEMAFSPTNHLGTTQARLSQLQDGRWKVVVDYAQLK